MTQWLRAARAARRRHSIRTSPSKRKATGPAESNAILRNLIFAVGARRISAGV